MRSQSSGTENCPFSAPRREVARAKRATPKSGVEERGAGELERDTPDAAFWSSSLWLMTLLMA